MKGRDIFIIILCFGVMSWILYDNFLTTETLKETVEAEELQIQKHLEEQKKLAQQQVAQVQNQQTVTKSNPVVPPPVQYENPGKGSNKVTPVDFKRDSIKIEPKLDLEKPPVGGEIPFYVEKLQDTGYYVIYNHDYKWYAAAEELGKIGAPAIPAIYKNLNGANRFERSQTFYALLLASQNKNSKALIGNEYIKVGVGEDPSLQQVYLAVANNWWKKHGDKFTQAAKN